MDIRDKPRTQAGFTKKSPQYVEGSIVSSTIISTVPAAKPVAAKKPLPPWSYLLILGLALVLVRVLWLAVAQATPQATIVIHPAYVDKRAVLQLIATVSPVTATQVPVRQLTSQQASSHIRVPATGIVRQPATSAHGTLMFYNPTSVLQQVQAGITLTTGQGIEITTDQAATIPPGSKVAANGVPVSAHVRSPGALGNIPPFTLDGLCSPCGGGLVVKNILPFSGGQDTENYTVVSRTDLDNVASTQMPALEAQASAALRQHMRKGEQLGTPITCAQQVKSNLPVGTRATTVSVQVVDNCTALACDPGGIQQKAAALFSSEVQRSLEPHEVLVRPITTSIEAPFTVTTPEMLSISVQVSGRWVYTMSAREQARLLKRLAGESRQQALDELQGEPGIRGASIVGMEGEKLPHDPSQLSLQFVLPL